MVSDIWRMVMHLYKEPIEIELVDGKLLVNGKEQDRSIRTLDKMQDVLLENGPMPTAHGSGPLYYMYRAVYEHKTLRYDITYILGNLIGNEHNKTYGHYHPKAKDDIAYPELYQVLKGSATFILQKKIAEGVDVLIIDAKENEIVLFPPEYGHVSVNPGNKDLVLANIVSNSFESNYSEYKNKRGAAYYYTQNGLVQNKNYKINSMEKLTASEINKRYNINYKDLLTEFYKNPETFEFLERPSLRFKK